MKFDIFELTLSLACGLIIGAAVATVSPWLGPAVGLFFFLVALIILIWEHRE